MDGFLERLPELVIVVGKGGVGKTTCAIGVASALAASGQPTLLVSTDPAGSLGPVLGTTLAGGVARRIEAVPGLAAMQLEPAVTRKEFLAHREDNQDIEGTVTLRVIRKLQSLAAGQTSNGSEKRVGRSAIGHAAPRPTVLAAVRATRSTR